MPKSLTATLKLKIAPNTATFTDASQKLVKTGADRVVENAIRLGDVFRGVFNYRNTKVVTARRDLKKINGRRVTGNNGVMLMFTFEGTRALNATERRIVKTNLDTIFGSQGTLDVVRNGAPISISSYYTNTRKPKQVVVAAPIPVPSRVVPRPSGVVSRYA